MYVCIHLYILYTLGAVGVDLFLSLVLVDVEETPHVGRSEGTSVRRFQSVNLRVR